LTLALAGCEIKGATPPATAYAQEIHSATVDQTNVVLHEGDSYTFTFTLDSPIRSGGVVQWSILGGAGRFDASSGIVILDKNATSFAVTVNSVVDQEIEAPTDLILDILSVNLQDEIQVPFQMIDDTTPAVLTVQSPTQSNPAVPTTALVFAPAALSTSVYAQMTLKNTGEVDAGNIVATVTSPFRFHGGSYPGTDGTCTTYIAAGTSCTLDLEFNSAATGSFDSNITFTYVDGVVSNQTLSAPVHGSVSTVLATLTNTPDDPSNDVILNVTVGGSGITQYKYKVGADASTDCSDSSGYSAATAIATHITDDISGLADGTIKICAVGYNGSTWQDVAAATFATWTKITQPPQNPTIQINDGNAYTQDTNVTLTLAAQGASFMYITNAAGCASGGSWEAYATSKAWVLNAPNTTDQVYVMFRDLLNNDTACINASIIHDNIAPTVTVNRAVGQANPAATVPVNFDVQFSEPVLASSFTSGSVVQNGTATGLVWAIAPLSGGDGVTTFDHYSLTAVSLVNGGTIIPSLAAGLISDPAGNLNQVSTSTDATVVCGVVNFYFSKVFSGTDVTCGAGNNSVLYCWGNNAYGEMGSGTTGGDQLVPASITMSTLNGFRKVIQKGKAVCGLAFDGKIRCWGGGADGILGAKDTASNDTVVSPDENVPTSPQGTLGTTLFSDFAIGSQYACAIMAGAGDIYCWGNAGLTEGQLGGAIVGATPLIGGTIARSGITAFTTGVAKEFKSIVAGDAHTCALAADGKVYCWGRGSSGQLGNGASVQSATPVLVSTGGISNFDGFVQIAAGGNTTCALQANGDVYCWGAGTDGQLGSGVVDSNLPVKVDTSGLTGFRGFASVSVGFTHACARSIDSKVYCWGDSSNGKLGQSSPTSPVATVEASLGIPLQNIVSLSVGDNHTCAVNASGQMFCWGQESADGRLGDGGTVSSTQPVTVQTSSLLSKNSYVQIASGEGHSCAVTSAGLVQCWGTGTSGQLGSGVANSNVPRPLTTGALPAGTFFQEVTAGTNFSCGLTTSGDVYCWGANESGQLGNNTMTSSAGPLAVVTSGIANYKGFRKVKAGGRHACALHADGDLYCWGYNLYGQLGNNTTTSSLVPVKVRTDLVSGVGHWLDFDVGDMHTCALDGLGRVFCWGYGALGRLGNGFAANQLLPVATDTTSDTTIFSPDSRVVGLAVGAAHGCALMSGLGSPAGNANNMAVCWGQGADGRLGNSATNDYMTPTPVSANAVIASYKGFLSIDAGDAHTCALSLQGTTYCWGNNSYGRIGNNDTTSRLSPTATIFTGISDFASVLSVSAGGTFTCAVGSDSDSYCWGEGDLGEIGNGQSNHCLTPSKVSGP
jgi:alpha-tubulin suppressor-like RCC1 family protein